MGFPYSFKRGFNGFGIGVEDLGFERPTSIPANTFYGSRYNVRKTLEPQAPGYVLQGQSLVSVDLKGDGAYFAGAMAMQALSDFNRGKQ